MPGIHQDTDKPHDPLDVPYDQSVPLPACWRDRSTHKTHRHPSSAFAWPGLSALKSRFWPMLLVIMYLSYIFASSMQLPQLSHLNVYHTAPQLHRFLYPTRIGSHRVFTVGIEEAQVYLGSLQAQSIFESGSTITTTILKAQSEADVASSAAADFTLCHNDLIDEHESSISQKTDCEPLYNKFSACHTRLLSFLSTHGQISATVKELERAILQEASNVTEWEAARSRETRQEMRSVTGIMKDILQVFSGSDNLDNFQDPEDRREGHRRRELKMAAEDARSRLRELCIFRDNPSSAYIAIKDIYSSAIRPFVDSGCGEVAHFCLCSRLDLGSIAGTLKAIGSHVSYLR